MCADIHDGQEHKRSVQGPDTEAQDQSSPDHHIRLATHGRSIQTCQNQTSRCEHIPIPRSTECVSLWLRCKLVRSLAGADGDLLDQATQFHLSCQLMDSLA